MYLHSPQCLQVNFLLFLTLKVCLYHLSKVTHNIQLSCQLVNLSGFLRRVLLPKFSISASLVVSASNISIKLLFSFSSSVLIHSAAGSSTPSVVSSFCPVSWGCGIHWLHLCRGVRPPQQVSWYNIIQSDSEVSVMLSLWEMRSTPLLPSLPGSLRFKVVAPDMVLSMGEIELNCVLMLNWIAWNKSVLIFKLHTYTKLIYLKWNCFCMLNWIAWKRTVFDIENVLTLNWIVWNRTVLIFNWV